MGHRAIVASKAHVACAQSQIGGLVPLCHLAVVGVEVAMADIAECVVAGGPLERGSIGRPLRRTEHRAHVRGDRYGAAHDHEREHRHRHHQEPGHRRDVLVDRVDPRPVGKRNPARRRRIGLSGQPVHDEHVDEDVDWSPGGEVEEPGEVSLERRDAAFREQQQRKDDREERVEHDRQHDVQHRNPDKPLLGRGGHGVAGLGIGALERERIAVGIAEVELRSLEGIDYALLFQELVAARGGAGEQLRDERHVGSELGPGGGLAELGVHGMGKRQRIGIDLGFPLPVDQRPGLGTGLALDIDRAGTGIGQVLHAAVGCGTRAEGGPKITGFAEEL